MSRIRFGLQLSALVVLVHCVTHSAAAGPVQVGGNVTVSGVNFPVNFGPTALPIDGAAHSLAGGQLQAQTKITDVDANTQWLELIFSTPNGTLAGNLNANWNFNVTSISADADAGLIGVFYYWSVDGVAVPNIHNWAGGQLFPDGVDGTNPIDPSLGKGFGGLDTAPYAPLQDTLGAPFFINPYSFIGDTGLLNEGDMPYQQINDFHWAYLITRIPEPSSSLLLALAASAAACCRRKN